MAACLFGFHSQLCGYVTAYVKGVRSFHWKSSMCTSVTMLSCAYEAVVLSFLYAPVLQQACHVPVSQVCYGSTETSPVTFQSLRDCSVEKRVSTVGRVASHVEVNTYVDFRAYLHPTPFFHNSFFLFSFFGGYLVHFTAFFKETRQCAQSCGCAQRLPITWAASANQNITNDIPCKKPKERQLNGQSGWWKQHCQPFECDEYRCCLPLITKNGHVALFCVTGQSGGWEWQHCPRGCDRGAVHPGLHHYAGLLEWCGENYWVHQAGPLVLHRVCESTWWWVDA